MYSVYRKEINSFLSSLIAYIVIIVFLSLKFNCHTIKTANFIYEIKVRHLQDLKELDFVCFRRASCCQSFEYITIEYFENQYVSEFTAGKNTISNATNSARPIKVSLIVCNVPTAGVLEIAKKKGIPTLLINKTEFAASGYVESLKNADIDFIVLAGFLWKVPEVLVNAYQKGAILNNQRKASFGIINIHPALLPNYGGKGMYGARVHEAVIASGESKSGITIHWVDANYDEGDIIFQAECTISSGDTPEILAQKIHALEHQHFAPVIEKILRGLNYTDYPGMREMYFSISLI